MKTLTTSPLARAKDRLRIPDLWDRLALDGTPSKSCRSPFRDDRAPSFSVSEDGLLWNDFAEGTGGDAVDLLAKATGLDNREAARRFIEMAGGSEPSVVSITRRPKPAPARKFRPLPDLQPWEISDAMTLARLRRWPLWAGLEIAARRGLLGAVDLRDGSGPPVRCWAVTDDRRAVMQARRLNGEPFSHRWDGTARKWTPCPPFKSKTLCADPAMTAAGGLIGRAVGLAPKTSDPWREFPNLWACAVGQPSAMKSPALSEMLAPLHALEANEREAWQPRLEQYERDLARYEIEKKAAATAMQRAANAAYRAGERAELGELPDEPEKPTCPRIVVSDATIEAVVRIAAGNPRGLLMVRDELAGWLATFKKAGREADRAFYLEAASGKNSISVDRKGDGSLFADPLALAVVGSIQPGPLQKLVADASESTEGNDGLLQRFGLLVWPDLPEGKFRLNDAKPDREARLLYVETLKHLRTLETEWTEETGLLRFTTEARKEWHKWFEAEMNELRAGGVPDALHAHRVKLAGKTCLGLALICECCDTPQPQTVGLTPTKRAIRFTEILKTHAARLYAPQVSPDVLACRLLAKKIQAGKLGETFTCRDVYRHGWTGLDKDSVPMACERLTALGWIRPLEATGAGRPKDAFAVNPKL